MNYYTWFELVELVVLPLPAPDAPDALAAVDASADGAGDSPCCDVPAMERSDRIFRHEQTHLHKSQPGRGSNTLKTK